MLSISYTIVSFIFSIILMIVYFSKKRIDYIENKVYSFIVGITVLSCFVEILSFIQVVMGISSADPMYHFTIKALFLCFLAWLYLFTIYTVITGKKLRGKFKKELFSVKKVSLLLILMIAIIMFLPIEIVESNGLLLPVGLSVTLIYTLAAICIIVMIVSMLLSRKNWKSKKYVPLYLLVLFFGITLVIQNLFPELLIINTAFVITTFSMYFTIENPDMKMVEELIDNRKIIERASEEKSIFLFKMSQGLKEPVNTIDKQITLYNSVKGTNKEIDQIIDNIDKSNKKIEYLINDVLGINSFDSQNVMKVKNTYNIYSLLENVKVMGKNYLNDDIDYSFEILENIPKELYGDGIRLKQVLMSVLINSINRTKKGFVHVDVNSFTKYDICRLVVTVDDSGSNISVKEINDILDQDLEITDQEYLKIEKINVDLPLAYKIIKSLGGTMYIKSEEKKGAEITITLDQYIVVNKEIQNNSMVDSYIKTRKYSKKILIVDDDEEEIRKIKKTLERQGYDVVISMYGKDAIDRIKNKEKYDFILIDDEMPLMSGINVLQELNELKNKSKKIVLLEKDKLFIAKHYLKDGFDEYIDKENLIQEIENKIN